MYHWENTSCSPYLREQYWIHWFCLTETDIGGAEAASEGIPEESPEDEIAEETTGETAGQSAEETAKEVEVKKSTLKVTSEDGGGWGRTSLKIYRIIIQHDNNPVLSLDCMNESKQKSVGILQGQV